MEKYTEEDIRGLFQSKFNAENWQKFIVDFFGAKEVKVEGEKIDVKEGAGLLLGYLNTSDKYRISFFYIRLDGSVDRRKVGLRQLITPYIKIDSDAGIGVFDDGKHWRLSFITDLKDEETSPRRFTFVLGERDNYYRTAVDRFKTLQQKEITFANIKEAFSVEALTKQFYNDLFEWYLWALKDDTGVYFPNNPNTPVDDRENLDTKIIRLITRLMFVWFIKQKGLVPNALFDEEEVSHWLKDFDPQSMDSGNYYQAILQNLFFATLNRPIKNVTYDKQGNEVVERRCFAKLKDKPDVKSKYRYEELFKISEDKILSIYEFIPFINGGLFECLDKNKTTDGTDYTYFDDGFSRNANRDKKTGRWSHRAFVPNRLFFDAEYGIISIFNRYNFTVEENTPSEQQVALDPELLGKVFENLLGVYNPETKETARNQSGSFYTPREIVNYMVDISLQAYLGNTDEVKGIFADDFVYDEGRKAFYESVVEKLKSIKVLDPACGSGAFPMGMLNRIVDIMERLKAPGSKYELKLQIMENCIYGGDIQAIAAQITKLRFFISLVCDCEKSDNADENYGIPNLPNLETHFVTCDSLIGLEKTEQHSLFEADVTALKEELKRVRHEHFMAKTVYQKTKLRDRDKELREELVKMLSDDNVIDVSKDAEQMANWNPYDQNAKAPFFDPEWMFGIKEGFDVVIGNPPYVQLQANDGQLAKLYKDKNFKTFDSTGDIYCLFYEQGMKMLRNRGILCLITSNNWMRTGYGENLRSFFTTSCNPLLLVNFADFKVFNAATVETNILLLTNETNKKETQCATLNSVNNLSEDVTSNGTPAAFEGSSAWVVLNVKEEKIRHKFVERGKLLKDWNMEINYGIKTGYNSAFVIDTETRNKILSECANEEERERTSRLIQPTLRGRDIKRYTHEWANLWLINTHNGTRDGIKPIDINRYPAVKKHLDKYKNEIEKRGDKGVTAYNLRNCAYLKDLTKPKIAWIELSDTQKFTYCIDEIPLNTVFFLTGELLMYMLGLLNSKAVYWYFTKMLACSSGMGTTRWLKFTMEQIPIAEASKEQQQLIIDLVEKILLMKREKSKADTSAIESEIDSLVYELYGLTEEEIAIIEEMGR